MTTVVAEAKQEVKSEGVTQFEMPKVSVGDPVQFWPGGTRTTDRGEVGTVFGVGRNGRTINIRVLATGQARFGVRHINDPRLTENQEVRSEGAWEHSQLHLRIESLEKAVATLQGEVDELKAKRAK